MATSSITEERHLQPRKGSSGNNSSDKDTMSSTCTTDNPSNTPLTPLTSQETEDTLSSNSFQPENNDRKTTHHHRKSPKGSHRRKPASVRFDMTKLKVLEIDTVNEMSRKEKEKQWITEKEFDAIKVDCQLVLNKIEQAKEFDILQFRGLEMVDQETVSLRRKKVRHSVKAVLKEQHRQRKLQTSDPEKIVRKAYKAHVLDSMRVALENAYVDEAAVEEYMATTNKEIEVEYAAKRDAASKTQDKRKLGGAFKTGIAASFKVGKTFRRKV